MVDKREDSIDGKSYTFLEIENNENAKNLMQLSIDDYILIRRYFLNILVKL